MLFTNWIHNTLHFALALQRFAVQLTMEYLNSITAQTEYVTVTVELRYQFAIASMVLI